MTGLWAYSAVFLEAMAAQLPLSFLSASHSQELDVWIYTGVFALLVIPLSCLDLTEQASAGSWSAQGCLSLGFRLGSPRVLTCHVFVLLTPSIVLGRSGFKWASPWRAF